MIPQVSVAAGVAPPQAQPASGGYVPQAGARVTVELDWDTMEPSVVMCAERSPYGMPSNDADLRAWIQGACYGVRFALGVANSMPCTVRITEMYGEVSKTSATLVAAAAACAVWEALAYTPPSEVEERIRTRVAESRYRSPMWLASFDR